MSGALLALKLNNKGLHITQLESYFSIKNYINLFGILQSSGILKGTADSLSIPPVQSLCCWPTVADQGGQQ